MSDENLIKDMIQSLIESLENADGIIMNFGHFVGEEALTHAANYAEGFLYILRDHYNVKPAIYPSITRALEDRGEVYILAHDEENELPASREDIRLFDIKIGSKIPRKHPKEQEFYFDQTGFMFDSIEDVEKQFPEDTFPFLLAFGDSNRRTLKLEEIVAEMMKRDN